MDASAAVDTLYRSDWGRIVATLIRLALDVQVALTLRTLCGLETEEIARAFLVPAATMAQRLVRAKRKIRTAGIPYVVPDTSDRPARLDEAGDVVLLDEQDRRRWNHAQLAEAWPLVEEALGAGPGPFALQAAIAAVHGRAARAEDTDWPEILRLYERLETVLPSPVVSLNRAVAVAMVQGPRPALALIDTLAAGGHLDDHHLLHAARADLLRRLGSASEAAESYTRALALVGNESERRFLQRRLREVTCSD